MPTHHGRHDILNILGPILGGVITEKSTWRWIYLFNAPAAVIGVTALLVAWPKSHKPKVKKNRSVIMLLAQIDLLGAILLLLASALLVFALHEAGAQRYNWDSPGIIASLAISCACWCAFIAWIFWLDSSPSRVNIKSIFPLSVALSRPTGPAIL
jgi:Fungal trichothecene efflux pump (TRI12)